MPNDDDRKAAEDRLIHVATSEHTDFIATFAAHRLAAEQRGYQLGVEDAAKAAEEWFPSDTINTYRAGGVVAAIRRLGEKPYPPQAT